MELSAYQTAAKVTDRRLPGTADNDGYRYHDAFHLAYVVFLGWSPIQSRKLISRFSRRSNP